ASGEGTERREAAKRLIEDRKAELTAAEVVAEKAIQRAKEARQKADEATEQAGVDDRNYRYEKARPREYPNTDHGEKAYLSKEAAKEAVREANECEEKARGAVKAVDEIRAAVRRAEEAAVR